MTSTLARSAIVLPVLVFTMSAPADAQLSRLKDRVKRAVQDVPGAAPAAQQPAATTYNEHVLEMTPEILDRLERGLAAEEADRGEIARLAASVRTPEAYQTCLMQAMTSSEGQAVNAASMAKAEAYIANTADQAAAAAYQEAQAAVVQYMADTCGPDPDQFHATELPKLQTRPATKGREAGEFTAAQYAILKERIVPLCGLGLTGSGDAVRIPGEGTNIFWVYSPAEVESLLPRCAELSRLVQATS